MYSPRMDSEPYFLRIKRLREEQGLSQDELFRRAGPGVGHEMVRRVQRDPAQHGGTSAGARYPSPKVLESIAQGLGVPATEFPEYRLARARAGLDERVVGLEAALANLAKYDGETDGSEFSETRGRRWS